MEIGNLLNCSEYDIKQLINKYIEWKSDLDPLSRAMTNFDDFLSDYYKCEVCEEYDHIDNLINTEGLVNGGYGFAHQECYEDGR